MQEERTNEKNRANRRAARSAKELTVLSVFVALTIAAQLVFSTIPGVEVVTVLFVTFCYAFGVSRGMIVATAFSLLRCLLFGFFPNVVILYLIYYNLLALTFGLLGRTKFVKNGVRFVLFVGGACLCTVAFIAIDNLVTPLFYGYAVVAWKAYALASLPFLLPQTVCTAITVSLLFYPLERAFALGRKIARF